MKSIRAIFTSVILLLAGNILAQNPSEVDKLLMIAEQQFDEKDESGSLETYLEVLEHNSENYDALWNASLLYSAIGYRQKDDNIRREYFELAGELAKKSIELYPDKGHPYYVMAVAKARLTEVVGTRGRIGLAYEIEENVQKSLDLMPKHASSWHLYGVWQSEVANVSRAERMAARFLSRGLPNGSNEKAEEYLKKAVELDPESIHIRLDLARHYQRVKEDDKAIAELQTLLELEPVPKTKDDPDYLEQARELLVHLQ